MCKLLLTVLLASTLAAGRPRGYQTNSALEDRDYWMNAVQTARKDRNRGFHGLELEQNADEGGGHAQEYAGSPARRRAQPELASYADQLSGEAEESPSEAAESSAKRRAPETPHCSKRQESRQTDELSTKEKQDGGAETREGAPNAKAHSSNKQDHSIRATRSRSATRPKQKLSFSNVVRDINYEMLSKIKSGNQPTRAPKSVVNVNDADETEYQDAGSNQVEYAKPQEKQRVNSYEAQEVDYEDDADYEQFRERREIKDTVTDKVNNPNEQNTQQPSQEIISELANANNIEAKEQTAIKKSIATLSSQQLNELLSSLPLEKRELLQEIIGNEKDIRKRDIIKKDGVSESENKGGKPEIVNIQEVIEKQSSGLVDPDKSATETATVSSNVGITSGKISSDCKNEESSLVLDNSVQIDESKAISSSKDENLVKVVEPTNEKAEDDKTNAKREVKLDDYSSLENSEESDETSNGNGDTMEDENDESGYQAGNTAERNRDADTSELNEPSRQNDRESIRNPSSNQQSRNIAKNELSVSEQLQALENSFPGVQSFDELARPDRQLSPLVRVKRNKRDSEGVASNPDSPYRADTDDEDDDEGTEFEDDGFFDRTSNLGAERQPNMEAFGSDIKTLDNTKSSDKVVDFSRELQSSKAKLPDRLDSRHVSNVGSDTDNVLSGAEGADENLMLTRARLSRDVEAANSLEDSEMTLQDKQTASEELDAGQNDANGAFGGLPKNYDGELGRYKRIRRTKSEESPEAE